MKHKFEVFGGFDIVIENKIFCMDWDDAQPCVKDAIGCYMMAIRGNSRITPWYVGKTINSFGGEIFQPHKQKHYKLAKKHCGLKNPKMLMFLFPLMTSSYKFGAEKLSFARGRSQNRLICWLEETLIGMAYARNPHIRNVKDATFLKTACVRGILGEFTGRPDEHVAEARKALIG